MGVSELRRQATAILRRVQRGESIQITDHGRPVARIVPIRPGRPAQLMSEGLITLARGDLLETLETLGLPAPAEPGTRSASEVLQEMREEDDR